MTDRSVELKAALETTVERFGRVLVENKRPLSLLKKNNCGLQKNEVEALFEKMKDETLESVKAKFGELITDTQVDNKFEQLAVLEEEGLKMNEKLGTEKGYRNIKPKVDIELHCASQYESILETMNGEITSLIEELKDIDKEIQEKTSQFEELSGRMKL